MQDATLVCDRFARLQADALALAARASEQRMSCREYRKRIGERRYRTIQVIWRSRQLRYDKHGRIVAMWPGGGDQGVDSFDPHRLDEVINAVFRVSLILSSFSASLNGGERARMQMAVDEMDRLIRDIRQRAFDEQRQARIGKPESTLWLTRIREATAGIDRLLQTGASPFTAFDLGEASQAAHRAIIALGDTA